MLELRLNLPEIAEFVKMIPNSKEKIFELMRFDLKQNATDFVNSLLSCELDLFLGRGKHERQILNNSIYNLTASVLTNFFFAKKILKKICVGVIC